MVRNSSWTRRRIGPIGAIAAISWAGACGPNNPAPDGDDRTDVSDVIWHLDAVSEDVGMDSPPAMDLRDIPIDRARDVPVDIPMDNAPTCALTVAYSYGYEGGLTAYQDTSLITPTNGWHRTRVMDDASLSCAVAIPACGADAGIDLGAVLAAIDDADVRAALALPMQPLYGVDNRPADGQVWSFTRVTDGHGFLVGDPCTASADGCTQIPAGIARLEAVLYSLDQQQLMDPSCAGLQ